MATHIGWRKFIATLGGARPVGRSRRRAAAGDAGGRFLLQPGSSTDSGSLRAGAVRGSAEGALSGFRRG